MWLLHEMKCDKNFDILELRTLTIVSWYHFIISGSRWTSSPGCRSSRSPQMISDPRQVRKYHDQNIVFLKRKWSSKNIIQLSLLKNWNDLSFNCVETGSSWGSNLTSCKKWLGEQETTLERDKKSKKRQHILMSPLFYRASPAVAARPTQTRPPGSCLWAASAGKLTRSGSGSILVSSGPWQTCWWWRTPSLRWDTVTIMTSVTWPVMQIQPRKGQYLASSHLSPWVRGRKSVLMW